MKLVLLSSLLTILILVISINQVEAYNGLIAVESDASELVQGDIINVEVFLVDVEPDNEIPLKVQLIEKGTGLPAEEIISIPDWIFDDRTHLGDSVWKTSFEFNTASENLTTETTYYIKAIFDDVNDITSIFAFSPEIPEQIIEEKESIKESIFPSREIPSWIRDIFIFYAEEKIDDDTLLNAIEYLISEKIIKIN